MKDKTNIIWFLSDETKLKMRKKKKTRLIRITLQRLEQVEP